MPKLNLDIFGSGSQQKTEPEFTVAPTSPSPPEPDAVQSRQGKEQTNEKPGPDKRGVRFIPVGFHEEHLHLLDKAVHALRLRTYWNASKSDIIRALIELHRDELDSVWLKQRKR